MGHTLFRQIILTKIKLLQCWYQHLYEHLYKHIHEHSYKIYYENSYEHFYEHLDEVNEHFYLCKQLNNLEFHKQTNLQTYRQTLSSVSLGRGKKFERKKVRIAEKVELFSSRTFFFQIFFGSYGSRGATTMADHSF